MRSASTSGRAAAWAVPVANEVAVFARSVVLARFLGAEELGKIMLLALALRLVEMASDLSVERLMAQAMDGGTERMQANLQGFAVLRGAGLALVLVLLAVPMSLGFADGPTALTFAALALAPLLRGFVHLDYRRRERRFDYRGLMVVDGGAAVAMLVSAPFAAQMVGDHRAFLVVLMVHVAALVVLSHLVAERRYQLALEWGYGLRLWRFGAPLIVNAGLMFLTFQADRLIVAGYFGWSELALYGVALQLALLPAQIAGRAAASLLAPAFRRSLAEDDLASAAGPALRGYGALALVFFAGFGLLAGPFIRAVYGAEFDVTPALLWALGLAAAIRIARTPVSQLAVSLGKTAIPMRGNILRALALVPALGLAMAGHPVHALALAAAAGEALAALRAWGLLKPHLVTTHDSAKPVGASA